MLEIVEHVMINAHFSPVDMDDAFSKKVFESYIKKFRWAKALFFAVRHQ